MLHRNQAMLLCPVGEDDYGTVWRRYALCGIDLEVKESADGRSAAMYIFDCAASATCRGEVCGIPDIMPGCLVLPSAESAADVSDGCCIPDDAMKVVSVERRTRGSWLLRHVKLILK